MYRATIDKSMTKIAFMSTSATDHSHAFTKDRAMEALEHMNLENNLQKNTEQT